MHNSLRENAPFRVLSRALNNKVLVKLKDGSEYVGLLHRYDTTMNLVLIDAEEVQEGRTDPPIAKYGKIMIRGSNILYIVVNFEEQG
ncbi:MAG: Sm ribonucleo [Thermoprotei archaeon]|nr:MAG: Sm ribonucleo [Thermoprotei archaeon]RLF18435.1 MAG: Sm ribonucleo [Thermoprotei archaeon]